MNWKKDFTLTAKEKDNLVSWEEWGKKMAMLRAIHREITPQLAKTQNDDLNL